MDNSKTGAFIRELRKEKGLTQKDLAEQLHITDRAVSKWERGLCAPDLSTLEPLADILGVTVTELISGKRIEETPHKTEIEESVQSTLQYSKEELRQKTRTLRKKYRIAAGSLLALLLLVLAVLWWKGIFNIIHRSESPDGTGLLTVYDRDIAIDRFSREPHITVINKYPDSTWSTVIYSGVFQDAWWSPDSEKIVIAFQDEEVSRLVVHSRTTHNTSNLNASLSIGVEQSELGKYDFQDSDGIFPEIEYQFLQWGLDSRSMLIYYSFIDTAQALHEGYSWYNCETGEIAATLELNL